MRTVRTGNLTLVTLMAEDINHSMGNVDRKLRSFVHPFQLVGVATFLTDRYLPDYFENLVDEAKTGISRAWSGKGQVHIDNDNELHIFSWLPGDPSPVDFIPGEDDDVLIGDFPLTRENYSTFLNALDYLRPLPLRKSQLIF